MKRNTQNSDNIWLYGNHTVKSIISNKKRNISRIICTSQNYEDLKAYVLENRRADVVDLIKVVKKEEIEKNFFSAQINHQGVAVNCSKKHIYNIDDLFREIENSERNNHILVLDQLTDPQNIGAIIRSAAAFGIKHIAIPNNSFPGETASMVKASSGNFEKVQIYNINNVNNMLEKIKKFGYWCVGLAGESNDSIAKIKEFEKVVIVVGSEGSGIRSLVKKNCDVLLKIDIEGGVESLNASNAASIALYELYKK